MADDFGVTPLHPLPPAGNAGDSKENLYAKESRRRKKGKKGGPGFPFEEEPEKEQGSYRKDEAPSGKVLDILI